MNKNWENIHFWFFCCFKRYCRFYHICDVPKCACYTPAHMCLCVIVYFAKKDSLVLTTVSYWCVVRASTICHKTITEYFFNITKCYEILLETLIVFKCEILNLIEKTRSTCHDGNETNKMRRRHYWIPILGQRGIRLADLLGPLFPSFFASDTAASLDRLQSLSMPKKLNFIPTRKSTQLWAWQLQPGPWLQKARPTAICRQCHKSRSCLLLKYCKLNIRVLINLLFYTKLFNNALDLTKHTFKLKVKIKNS